jgi:WhiB family redox-sensing transcriptional regulator
MATVTPFEDELVPTDAARSHLHEYRARGGALTDAAAAAGISVSTAYSVLGVHGRSQKRIARSSSDAIQAVPLPPLPASDPPDWTDQAECLGADTDLFFADVGSVELDQARAICARCPVSDDCLTANLREPYGMFGGHSATSRARIRRARHRDRRIQEELAA